MLVGNELHEVNPVKHTFADGCYIREIFNPAGSVLVTKIHKKEHPFFLMKGKMSILTENGVKTVQAPHNGVTPPGTKRVIYCNEDCIFVNIHKNPDELRDIKQLEEQYGNQFMSTFGRGVAHISKARVGLMTIQLATTVRNTTNGYMRNYIYAMDNLGTGVSNLTKAGGKYLLNFSKDATVKEEVDAAVALGVAQLKTSFDSLMLKDLHLGMTNANTQALFRLLADDVPTDIKVGSKVYTKDKKNIGKVLSIEADNATIKIININIINQYFFINLSIFVLFS